MDEQSLRVLIRETVGKYFKKSFIVAGNWKMNMTISDGMKFLEKLGNVDCRVMIFPPYTTLVALSGELKKRNIIYGAQNFHYEDKGAFTGEISIPMLEEVGCRQLLVGHSERRLYYNETDGEINKKIIKAVRSGFQVMVCIGENLRERRDGIWYQVLVKQLMEDLNGLSIEELQNVQIAYEPIWAIGTGVSASLEEIKETHGFLKAVMKNVFKVELPLLYGGSVNEKNAKEIGSCSGVDGFLVGGASLNADKFKKIIEAGKCV